MFTVLFKLFLLSVEQKGKTKFIKCHNGLDFFDMILFCFDMFVLLEEWKGL
jgi:hypothetical protein